MNENEQSPGTGKAIVWGVVGFIAGAMISGVLAGMIGLSGGAAPAAMVVGGIIIGFLAFSSSKKNNGAPPSWLWKSKKK